MERIQALFNKYYQKTASPQEREELFTLISQADNDTLFTLIHQAGLNLEEIQEIISPERAHQLLNDILKPYRQEKPQAAIVPYPPKIPRYRWISAAAALLLMTLYYFWQPSWIHKQPDIAPGGNRATLTLADGTKVALDSAQSGIIVNDVDIKYANGKLISGRHPSLSRQVGRLDPGSLSAKTSPKPGEMLNQVQHDALLQLSTPKGGQYQIILSDGTKVWLNANSSLKYPSRFSGDKREVYLEGEGYFLVAKSRNSPKAEKSQDVGDPFIVRSRNQQLTVLGTEFNINTYDPSIKTTLVTGAVQVSQGGSTYEPLKPGQQSILSNNGIQVQKADIKSVTAWKNNEFRFTNETLGGSMQQIARWYDIEIHFADNNLPKVPVSGIISRQETLSAIISLFKKATDLEYQLNGRTLSIQKK